MALQIIHTAGAPAAVGPYSQAIRTGGLLLTSGQLGLDPETGILPEGVEAQTKQALKNIDAILTEAGYSREDVVKTTVLSLDPNRNSRILSIITYLFQFFNTFIEICRLFWICLKNI